MYYESQIFHFISSLHTKATEVQLTYRNDLRPSARFQIELPQLAANRLSIEIKKQPKARPISQHLINTKLRAIR